MVKQKDILEEMNDVLMSGSAKNGKLKPIFWSVDEFAIDAQQVKCLKI